MRKKMLVFGQPDIKQAEINEVVDSLNKCWLGTGPKVHLFEKKFSEYKNINYSVALNSCTAALHLSLYSLNLQLHDEVIAPAMTFCATVNSIIHAGATPVLADVDAKTQNITLKEIEKKVTKNTKAIVVVHFAGRPCEMDKIMDFAKHNNIAVIEDCAHAIETKYKGQHVGTFGEFGCFSFYSTKNVVTGEGGMLIGNNKNMIDRIKILALHGISADAWSRFSDKGYKHYFVEEAGFKYNMMDIQAAIGIHQLKRVEKNWEKRKQIWDKYIQNFKENGIVVPAEIEKHSKHGYHLFTIQINEKKDGLTRDQFLSKMKENNIGTGVHYLSIAEHPFYQRQYNWKPEDYPNAFKFGQQTVSLPISPKLTDSDILDVIKTVRKVLQK